MDQIFYTADILPALGSFDNSEHTLSQIEHLNCSIYLLNHPTETFEEARWYLLTEKLAQVESLPPTREALIQHVIRA